MKVWMAVVLLFVATACSSDTIPVAEPARGWDGQLVGPGNTSPAPSEAPATPELSKQSKAPSALALSIAESTRATELEIKAERRSEYERTLMELFDLFHPESLVPATGPPPDTDVLAASKTGETARITTTVGLADQAEDAIIFTTETNSTTGYAHTTVDRVSLTALYPSTPWATSQPTPPGTVESLRDSANGGVWTRGVTEELARTSLAEVDPDRWYEIAIIDHLVSPTFAFRTEAELWATVNTPPPSLETDGQGDFRRATLGEEARLWNLGGFANGAGGPVTMTTRVGASGLVDSLVLQFDGAGDVSSVEMTVDGRGEAITVPRISDIVSDPGELINHIPADEYSWTATGTAQDSADSLIEGPWSVEGRVFNGRFPESVLVMNAGDASILTGTALASTPADQEIRRHGYTSTTYTTGLFPELISPWYDSAVDAEGLYIHDPFRVPADVFPSGLSEEDQWSTLRTVPSFVVLDGWDHERVSQGNVDPDYWNYRHRLGEGIFAWVASEDSAEIFEVTIGANEDGRIERFRLVTTDTDGGRLDFDVSIDAQAKDFIEMPNARAGYLDQNYSFEVEPAVEEALDRFDEFVAHSREQFPEFDHDRRPLQLTLLTERVMDEPTGAYEPNEDYFHWPSVYFEKEYDGTFPDGRGVVCLELDDNEFRFEDNTFEKYWRGYDDGGSLDGRILRFNTNAWLRVDIYASNGERHAGDPCAVLGA